MEIENISKQRCPHAGQPDLAESAITIDRVIVQNICAIVTTLHEKREFVNATSQAHLEARPSRLPSYLVLGKR